MRNRAGAWLGLASAATALGAAHLVAGLVGRAEASPIVAVGSASIDFVPRWLKDVAIDTFGTADKLVLVLVVTVVVGGLAIAVGTASLRRPRVGYASLVLLAAIGAVAAITRPNAEPIDVLPAVTGAVAGAVTLKLLRRRLLGAAEPGEGATDPDPVSDPVSRRRFLVGGAVAFGAAAVAGVTGQFLSRRSEAVASRARVSVPTGVAAAPPVPSGAELGVEGITPFITPNADFYRIDTALIVPTVIAEEWSLRVHGMVERELTLDFEAADGAPVDRARRHPRVRLERGRAATCIGNARWIGAPLADLLGEAGIDPAADPARVDVGRRVHRRYPRLSRHRRARRDARGRDERRAAADRARVPRAHGRARALRVRLGHEVGRRSRAHDVRRVRPLLDPARMGRAGADQDAVAHRHAGATAPMHAAGEVVIAGVAWAQHRGIDRVEVRVDDGPWAEADLATEDTIDTWRQWRIAVPLEVGNRTVQVRATDGDGAVQTAQRAEPFPDGATGQHSIAIQVT